jgi:ribA/ribD-fused uncharacterized protein
MFKFERQLTILYIGNSTYYIKTTNLIILLLFNRKCIQFQSSLINNTIEDSNRMIIPKDQLIAFYYKESPFSQFYPAKFTAKTKRGDIEFVNAEQYMMYYKAITFGDIPISEKILRESIPNKIKALGRQVKNFDQEVWNSVKFDIVVEGNTYKFNQNDRLKEELLATKNKILVEASPRDRIWGVGMGSKNPDIYDTEKWRGKNLLGKALMLVRDNLIE